MVQSNSLTVYLNPFFFHSFVKSVDHLTCAANFHLHETALIKIYNEKLD